MGQKIFPHSATYVSERHLESIGLQVSINESRLPNIQLYIFMIYRFRRYWVTVSKINVL